MRHAGWPMKNVRPRFIVNAGARPRGAPGTLDALRVAALQTFPGARWTPTSGPGDAIALAREAARDGADLVVAVGGDGTVNEVANGLLSQRDFPSSSKPPRIADAPIACGETVPGPALGILPAGSGSDFIRSLGVPRDALSALAVLSAGACRRIDAGRIVCVPLHSSPPSTRITRFFVNMAGCGASARVAGRFNRRHVPGALGYAAAAAITTLSYRWPEVEIRSDDGDARRVLLNLLFVCNGAFCGGGMQVGRGAALDDGRFLVVEGTGIGRLRAILEWPRLYRGWLAGVRGVTVQSSARLHVASREDVLVDCDGEICGKLPAEYSVLPGVLTVCVPAILG
jgi:diacylglycerol kinase (ATP)